MTVTAIPENHTLPEHSDRGFAQMPMLDSSYGAKVRVYESSSAEHPHVWLNVMEPADLNEACIARARGEEYKGEWNEATAHLSIETAKALAEQLEALIEDHYHFQTGQ